MDDLIEKLDSIEDRLANEGSLSQEDADELLRTARNMIRVLQSIGSDISLTLAGYAPPESEGSDSHE